MLQYAPVYSTVRFGERVEFRGAPIVAGTATDARAYIEGQRLDRIEGQRFERVECITPPFERVLILIAEHSTPGAFEAIRNAVIERPTKRGGTMRAWFEARHGQRVETVQIDPRAGVWIPGPRTVEATRAGSVQLDGSTRDYRGCRVIGSDETALVIEADAVTVLYFVTDN